MPVLNEDFKLRRLSSFFYFLFLCGFELDHPDATPVSVPDWCDVFLYAALNQSINQSINQNINPGNKAHWGKHSTLTERHSTKYTYTVYTECGTDKSIDKIIQGKTDLVTAEKTTKILMKGPEPSSIIRLKFTTSILLSGGLIINK